MGFLYRSYYDRLDRNRRAQTLFSTCLYEVEQRYTYTPGRRVVSSHYSGSVIARKQLSSPRCHRSRDRIFLQLDSGPLSLIAELRVRWYHGALQRSNRDLSLGMACSAFLQLNWSTYVPSLCLNWTFLGLRAFLSNLLRSLQFLITLILCFYI